jgi:16S rRNA processing protein RimM
MSAPNDHDAARASEAAAEAADGMIVIGRISGAYGVKGWVRISSFTVPPENLLAYQPWSVRGRQLDVVDAHVHGDGFVARIAGCDDRDAAARMAGSDLEVPAAALPALEEDEFYWRELIGLRVVNLADEYLGDVVGFMASGANDVMVLRTPGVKGERLVPFAGVTVRHVDRPAGRIVVDWGLDY